MTLTKLDRTNLGDLSDYNAELAEQMAKEGLCLTPWGEWVEIRPTQPTQPSLFDRLKGKISTACCSQRDCLTVVVWLLVVGILASCAAWFSLPILLGWLVFSALSPKEPV